MTTKDTQVVAQTHFRFAGQTGFYKGKVRDVYYFGDRMAIVATDRISAFDVVLPKAIPHKGAVLNQMAAHFLQHCRDIVPNWFESMPDPNASYGKVCQPVAIEMVVRQYLIGHAWREYQAGKRNLCGIALPEGMSEFQAFPQPIITPTTKASAGHDLDISKEEILRQNLVRPDIYEQMEYYSLALFRRGQEMALRQGLILADTKYEFGMYDGKLMLMDEIHTPDSSRYFHAEGFQQKVNSGQSPESLSKEFVRIWLMEHGFMGKEGQEVPFMPEEFVHEISQRYIALFHTVVGKAPELNIEADIAGRIERNIFEFRNSQKKEHD